jgi:hypothetical protein
LVTVVSPASAPVLLVDVVSLVVVVASPFGRSQSSRRRLASKEEV